MIGFRKTGSQHIIYWTCELCVYVLGALFLDISQILEIVLEFVVNNINYRNIYLRLYFEIQINFWWFEIFFLNVFCFIMLFKILDIFLKKSRHTHPSITENNVHARWQTRILWKLDLWCVYKFAFDIWLNILLVVFQIIGASCLFLRFLFRFYFFTVVVSYESHTSKWAHLNFTIWLRLRCIIILFTQSHIKTGSLDSIRIIFYDYKNVNIS